METWTKRSGKAIEKNNTAAIAACRKLHSKLTIVSVTKFTGNTSDDDLMRCATGLYYETFKQSKIYDVLRNKNYKIGTKFPYILRYNWILMEKKEELNLSEDFNKVYEQIDDNVAHLVPVIEDESENNASESQNIVLLVMRMEGI